MLEIMKNTDNYKCTDTNCIAVLSKIYYDNAVEAGEYIYYNKMIMTNETSSKITLAAGNICRVNSAIIYDAISISYKRVTIDKLIDICIRNNFKVHNIKIIGHNKIMTYNDIWVGIKNGKYRNNITVLSKFFHRSNGIYLTNKTKTTFISAADLIKYEIDVASDEYKWLPILTSNQLRRYRKTISNMLKTR